MPLKQLPVSFLILLAFLTAMPSAAMQDRPLIKWVVMKGSSLAVNGNTNVNTFSCSISDYNKADTLAISSSNAAPISFNGRLSLDVHSFDCHHAIMTADLRKILKAKEYPKLYVRFLNLNKMPDLDQPQETVKGLVEIELAGVKKRFEVHYKLIKENSGLLKLTGTRNMNFTDFNLVPPRKLGGMIQTNYRITVEFNLRIKVLDN